MIITKETDKQTELSAFAVPHDDVPPPYVHVQRSAIPNGPPLPSQSTSSGQTTDLVDSQVQIPDIPASNFVYIFKKDGSIRQSFVIDTRLDVPQDLSSIPPPPPPKPKPKATRTNSINNSLSWLNRNKDDPFAVDENAPRPHLKLESKDGSINTDIWLVHSDHGRVDPVPSTGSKEKGKAILDVGTKDGSVNLKLHSLTEQNVSLRVWSKDGSITVYIPSSFVGPVNIYTADGSVVPSAGISKRLSTFSQFDKTRKCFLGDFRTAGYTDAASWNGSSLDIMTKDGSVRLFLIEEHDASKSKGFMSKLLGSLLNV